MTLLIWLRIMADLSFYYAYAGFLASFTGSAFSLPGIAVPSLLCALSQRIGAGQETASSGNGGQAPVSVSGAPASARRRKALRTVVILPGLLLMLLPGLSAGDRAALLPALSYCAYLAWTDNYDLSHSRQEDVFLLFGRTYPVFFLIAAMVGASGRLLAYSLFPAVLTLTLCVFLLRILRHEPEVYLRPRFLMSNMLTLGAMLGCAWLLHLQAVTRALRTVLLAVYDGILAPILIGVLYVVVYAVNFAVSPLLALLTPGNESETILTETDLSIQGVADQTSSGEGSAEWLRILIQAAAVLAVTAAAVFVLVILFHYLAGTKAQATDSGLSSEELRGRPDRPRGAAGGRPVVSPLHPVNRVRRQYRNYLTLCRSAGFTPPDFYTTEDIRGSSDALFRDPSPAGELREIYIRARYQGVAGRGDADRAEEIVRQLKKSLKGKG